MATGFNDDAARKKELADAFIKEFNKRKEKCLNKFSDIQSEFINDTHYAASWRKEINSKLGKKLLSGLQSGRYKKPSEFFEKEAAWLFQGYIFPRFKEAFLYSADNCNQYQYSNSYYRRSFRTADYSKHIFKILDLVERFHEDLCIDKSICDILQYKVSEGERAYMETASWRSIGYNDVLIAYELDRGNEQLEDVLTDIMMGEGEVVLERSVIRGIIQSENHKMHQELGKLLLAARLQEGLRQAICENADAGTASAFIEILNVIDENNLIRFSSVKRAVGTWLGLIAYESGDLERISDKSVKLIKDCLMDENVRKDYLKTEDSMKIYAALWAYGFYEAGDAMDIIYQIAEQGTNHQLLTAGYFVSNLDNADFAHEISKKVIGIRNEEMNVLAVYIPYFMKDWRNCKDFSKYYENKDEAVLYYDIFMEIYDAIPKKSLDFSPCIFPWYQASLKKSDVITRLCLTALYLEDIEKKDFTCGLIKDCDRDNRSALLTSMLDKPDTPVQKMVLTKALCDKETYTRKKAFEIICNIRPDAENYLQMEEMLKYKAADMRANLIKLLYGQSDDMLFDTVERLLQDKKEEKRTAALDIIMQLSKDKDRTPLFNKCRALAEQVTDASTKEKILLENITGGEKGDSAVIQKELFTTKDKYIPKLPDNPYVTDSIDLFMTYFPDSKLRERITGKKNRKKEDTAKQAVSDCKSLCEWIQKHQNEEFVCWNGETHVIGDGIQYFSIWISDYEREIPCMPLWEEWYGKEIHSAERLVRMWMILSAYASHNVYTDKTDKYIQEIYGKGFEKRPSFEYLMHMYKIVERLINKYVESSIKPGLALAVAYWYVRFIPEDEVAFESGTPANNGYYYMHNKYAYLIQHAQIRILLSAYRYRCDENFNTRFDIGVLVSQKTYDSAYAEETGRPFVDNTSMAGYGGFEAPGQNQYILAALKGLISENEMYYFMFEKRNIGNSLNILTLLISSIRDYDRQVSERRSSRWLMGSRQRILSNLVGKTEDFNEEDKKILNFADKVYQNVIDKVLSAELKRGDSETEYSKEISKVHRIYGLGNFVNIISALGMDTLERSSYYTTSSKKGCLSHLLGVCIPDKEDNAEALKQMIKGTDITEKRLIEAALYSPEWIDIVGEYLGWEGFKSACWYFMAHMNESFDDKKKAVIARYTPITPEELNAGAFDIKWFCQAYDTLGEKRFQVVYTAAKYISDGSKHSRARKYADAALGKLKVSDTEKTIADKRNKDLVMAYSLIPLKGEKDVSRRYLFLQKFLKESKKFGSQRIASEKKAVEISMYNLAMNAGYTDVMRLTLNMETKLINDSRELFKDKEIDDVTVRLDVSENGKVSIICTKEGKALKSVPARLKKDKYIISLNEVKKKLTEQYRRTRTLFEQAMEDGIVFSVAEISMLQNNPVVYPIIRDLVFLADGEMGFLDGNELVDYSGNRIQLKDNDKVMVAHPLHLYQDGHWTAYQKNLFDRKAVQPFKQVFRELYVKTEEEMEMKHSLRYSGNQIQPAKTVACLKSRRWVADIEDGLQKVYYQENIVARIYALADWFSPADIEAPTLEWVEFSDRKTGESITIKEIPELIFSEVMRDVDMAVSVAHAGGVDPETSHSTIEMRAALLTFTLPLFKVGNVTVHKNHAEIEGKYGNYTVHLGSGVIHKQGGIMINVLPVHSQHRGRLFLPFADDDPKTAEIISKVLLFADDAKIKDPSILAQIK